MEKIHNSKSLIESLGKLIDKKIEVISADKNDKSSLEDDAVEHAKAYWMLGFSWDEIETVLEDLEFTPDVSKSAVKRAQNYAEETTKDGPFSVFISGQLIKLQNGLVGKLLNKFSNKIQLKMFDDSDELFATAAQIDMEASLKLKEAYVLRATANEILKSEKEYSGKELEDAGVVSSLQCVSKNLLNKIASMQKDVVAVKDQLKGNKVVISALGLEYSALEDLKDNLSSFTASVKQSDAEFSSIMPLYIKVADLLQSLKQTRSGLVDPMTKDQSLIYLDDIKKIVNNVDQAIPEINATQNTLVAAAKNKDREQTAQKVKATLTYIK